MPAENRPVPGACPACCFHIIRRHGQQGLRAYDPHKRKTIRTGTGNNYNSNRRPERYCNDHSNNYRRDSDKGIDSHCADPRYDAMGTDSKSNACGPDKKSNKNYKGSNNQLNTAAFQKPAGNIRTCSICP